MNSNHKRPWRFVVRVLVYGVLAIAVFLTISPSLRTTREYSAKSHPHRWCSNQLKRVGLALHNYHDTYDCFPPTHVADADGNALYSWRVLLQPFLDRGPTYDRFDKSQPWDSQLNSELLDYGYGGEIVCPMLPTEEWQVRCPTSYLAVAGPGTAWQGTKSVTKRDIKDGLAETILVIDVSANDIPWSKPHDLDVTAFLLGETDDCSQVLSSRHKNYKPRGFWKRRVPPGAWALFADGSVRYLPDTIPPEHLRAMLTIDGGERLPADGNF